MADCQRCGGELLSLPDGHCCSPRSVNDISDAELLRRVVAGCRPTRYKPRWSMVKNATGLGATFSAQLCQRFGFNPNELAPRRHRG